MKIVSTLLSHHDGPIDGVYSGDKAIELLRTNKYDLLITDLMMDGMSGSDLIRLALDERLIDSRHVMVITGEPAGSPHRAWLRKMGIYIMQKPFSMGEFNEALKFIWPQTA
jgi:DNA-binding response OmpR family regulator